MACRKCGAEVIGGGLCPACISSVKSHTGQLSRMKLAQAKSESQPTEGLDRHLLIFYSIVLFASLPLTVLIYLNAPVLGVPLSILLSINLIIYFLGMVTWTMLFMEISAESPFEGLMSLFFPYAIKIGLTSDSPRAKRAAIIYAAVNIAGIVGWMLFSHPCGRSPTSAAAIVFGDKQHICPFSPQERKFFNDQLLQSLSGD